MKRTTRLLSLALAAALICGVMLIAPVTASANTYQNNIINAVLNNNYLWNKETWNGTAHFEDLNFDGKPEFIVQDFGGSMGNISNRVFYYANGTLKEAKEGSGIPSEATDGYPGYLSLYYNKTTGVAKYLGTWSARNGVTEYGIGNYAFSFNGTTLSAKHYTGNYITRDYQGNTKSEKYYKNIKAYLNYSGASKITKAQYNKINKSYTAGYEKMSPTTVLISSQDWKTWYYDDRSAALFRSYDGYSSNITQLDTPRIMNAVNTNSGIKLILKSVPGAAKYRIFIKKSGKWKKLADTKSTTYIHKGVKSGAFYTYTVRCLSPDGKRYTSSYDASGRSQQFVGVPVPKAKNTSQGVKVYWKKVSGAQSYYVFVKSGKKWVKIGDTTGTSFIHSGAVNKKKYTYTVRCFAWDIDDFDSGYSKKGVTIRCRR